MTEVPVRLGDRSYSVVVASAILDDIGEAVRSLATDARASRRVAIVTDSNVSDLYAPRVARSLEAAGYQVTEIHIPAGEQHKNLAWLTLIYDRLVEAQLERTSPIVALGGGVVGDLGGFAAATYLRGVPLVQVPTTLLAQVDASIGGKTGVNHPQGKNLIGAFYQPRLVWSDVETLRTLPRREYRAGLAEVVKYGAILDADLFRKIEKNVRGLVHQDRKLLTEVVARCARLKAGVVGEDEREGEFRAILNFGHTVGHAVESLTEYKRYLHGEAVAIGMVCAGRLSRRAGFLDTSEERRLEDVLDALGLPTELPSDLRGEPLAIAIESDKKAAGGEIRFICLEGIGRTRFHFMKARDIAEAVEP